MNPRRMLSIIFSNILSCTIFLPAALASEWNQSTKVTFSQPVEIPHKVLPAGTYWFVLASSQSDREMVRIFNADRTKLCATLLTAPTIRTQATSGVEFKFAERRRQIPEALLDWYYPGLRTGHEFLYPAKSEKRLMGDAKRDVVASPMNAGSSFAVPGA